VTHQPNRSEPDRGGPGQVTDSSSETGVEDDEDSEDLKAWARRWVDSFPPWSDEQWREINAALGYRLKHKD